MSDSFEAIGYAAGFWLFLFNRNFRSSIIADWKASGTSGKFFIILDALLSTAIGFILPLALLVMLVNSAK
jgi:hypothetical protein